MGTKGKSKGKIVVMNGEKRRVMSRTWLKSEVRAHLRREGLEPTDRVNVRKLKRSEDPRDHSLHYYLSNHGFQVDDGKNGKRTRSAGRALQDLDFAMQRQHSYAEIARSLREAFPLSLIEDIYAGRTPNTFSARQHLISSEGGSELYGLFHPNHKDPRLHSLMSMLDSMYRHLEEREGIPISHLLGRTKISPDDITRHLTRWFYDGENLSQHTLSSRESKLGRLGRKVAYAVKFDPLPGRLPIKGGVSTNRFTDRLCVYLRESIPRIIPADVFVGSSGINRNLGSIAERELSLLLAAVRYADPKMKKMGPDFRRYFPAPLEEVITPKRKRNVQVRNGDSPLEADLRVVCNRGEHLLVEVKSLEANNGSRIEKMRRKYATATEWVDGIPIDAWIALLHMDENGGDHRKTLEDDGWNVMGRSEFRRFYRKSLEILVDKEPDVLANLPIPITDPEALLEVDRLVHERRHVLARRGNTLCREWIGKMLQQNTDALLSGDRVEGRPTYKQKYTTRFSTFAGNYRRELKGSLEGCLFMDLETTGFSGYQGFPIATLGMGYEKNGELVVEQWLVRDPIEEAAAIRAYERRAKKAEEIVTFNGDSYDRVFLAARARAHLIRQERGDGVRHLDLMKGWRKYAKEREFPRHRLQDYEVIRCDFRRVGDLSGRKIPRMFRHYLFGGDDVGDVGRMLEHNMYDIGTLAIMRQDKALRRIYSKK